MLGSRLKHMMFIVTVGSLGLAIGCHPSAPPAPAAKGGMPPPSMVNETTELEPGPFLEGRKVFRAHTCIKCHSIGAAAGKGKMKKSLTTVGADHPREWIIAHIRDAKTHNPKSRMPAYGTDKISDADMATLADYLTSLK